MTFKPLELKNLINGKWVPAQSGETLQSINPANTEDLVAIIPKSGKADVDAAVQAARGAYEEWRLTPAPERGHILLEAAHLIEKKKQELGELVTREMGKYLPEGLGDVQEAIDMCYFMGGEGRRMQGETAPSELREKDCKSIRVPIGVFGLITPWNFPIAIPSWKIAPALVCGDTMVFKPSSYVPACGSALVEILVDAGVPAGVLNLVHGAGSEAGNPLVEHPGLDAVSFTGSTSVGESIERKCAELHRHVSLEMGGKNAIIVMDDANLELAAEGVLWGAFGTTGQRCTACSRVIVHKDVKEKFAKMLVDGAQKLKIGYGLDKGVHMGPLVNEDQLKKTQEYVEIGKTSGHTLLTGGKVCETLETKNGYFHEPTIFDGVKENDKLAQEEIFGPVLSIIEAKDLGDAIRIVNNSDYGLSSAIYTQDVNKSAIAERDIETGIVYINSSTIGAEIQLPFGGVKHTGNGHHEAGGRGGALDSYSRWKMIYRDYSGKLQKAQID